MGHPFVNIAFFALLCFLVQGDSFVRHVKPEADVRHRQVEVPTTNSFRRRALHSIVVLGNYLYSDGGEINQYVNGDVDSDASRPVNITESISLSTSWTNSTVHITSIKRTAPNSKNFALWADETTKKIYAWGGEGPYSDTIGANNVHLWAFTPDNAGSGSWAVSVPDNPAIFTTLLRGSNGAQTSCNGMGFYLGGEATPASDASVKQSVALPGLLTYNMSTSTWANHTVPGTTTNLA